MSSKSYNTSLYTCSMQQRMQPDSGDDRNSQHIGPQQQASGGIVAHTAAAPMVFCKDRPFYISILQYLVQRPN